MIFPVLQKIYGDRNQLKTHFMNYYPARRSRVSIIAPSENPFRNAMLAFRFNHPVCD